MNFHSALDRVRRWRRLGRWLVALLVSAALAGLLALAAGLADAWFAFEASPRTTMVKGLLGVIAIAALALLAIASRYSRKRGAEAADRLIGSPRKPAEGAMGLHVSGDQTPMAKMLAERAQAEAAASLRNVPVSKLIGWNKVGMATSALVLALLPIGIDRKSVV